MANTPDRDVAVRFPFGDPNDREDYGFFGPGSPTWKVWTSPTALLGFQRSVVLEHFDPHLAAAVADAAGIYTDPRGRLDGTLAYFLIVATCDGRTAIESAELLKKVHARITGVDPVTGKRYSANNPDSQLWIHVTGWHSVLKCYEMYGPGKLSATEEAQYWRECVVAAELQTCRVADVPTSRAEVHDYFAAIRPTLRSSEHAERAMHYLLRTDLEHASPQFWAMSRAMAPATIATLPTWMRVEGRFDQPRALDASARAATRMAMRVGRSPALMHRLIRTPLPMTDAVLQAHYRRSEPAVRRTVTPAEVRIRLAAAG